MMLDAQRTPFHIAEIQLFTEQWETCVGMKRRHIHWNE